MINEKFCIFIASHKRANKVLTEKSLKKCGYTGDIVIVVDDKDPELTLYKQKYKNLYVFSKDDMENKIDTYDNFKEQNIVLYYRNKCFEIAEELGYDYFCEMDDDYTYFCYKSVINGTLTETKIKNFDNIVNEFIAFLKNSKIKTVCFSQNGDFVGGADTFKKFLKGKRKAMNSFFFRTNNPVTFTGRINEDVNMYCSLGSRGDICLQNPFVSLLQKKTQSNSGGLTDSYLKYGTYIKSFYTVLACPSFVTVRFLEGMGRIHHHINWEHAVPKIISEKWKKYN